MEVLYLLPPANEVCEGYVITRVCLSTDIEVFYLLPPANKVCEGYAITCVCPQGEGVPGQVPPGRYPPSRYPPGQVHPLAGTPPCAVHAGRYGQQPGCTHPTGMHSCVVIKFHCFLQL